MRNDQWLSNRTSQSLWGMTFVLIIIVFCASSFVIAGNAYAEPLGFRRVRATFSLGLDAFDALMGDFGSATDVGMSVYAETTLQMFGYFGLNLRFGTARGFTEKEYLPFDNGYQFIYLTFAPRVYFAPFRKAYVFFYMQPEISLKVMMSNTLVKVTGNHEMTGGVGGAIGVQYIIGIVSITGQIYTDYHWQLKTLFIGGGITVGIASTL